MNSDKKPSYYSLSPNEQIMVQEYVKAILRARVISAISGFPDQFKSDLIDKNFMELAIEILPQDELNSYKGILDESLQSLNNIFKGSVAGCLACLYNNGGDRNKCKDECNIPLKPPDEG